MKNFNIILTDKGIDSICFTVVTAVALKCIYKMVKEAMSYRKLKTMPKNIKSLK